MTKHEEPKPAVERDELHASTDLKELFRYRKGNITRVYNLRPLGKTAQLWLVSHQADKVTSQHLGTFSSPEEAEKSLHRMEQEIRAEGWTAI